MTGLKDKSRVLEERAGEIGVLETLSMLASRFGAQVGVRIDWDTSYMKGQPWFAVVVHDTKDAGRWGVYGYGGSVTEAALECESNWTKMTAAISSRSRAVAK
jgi:hypothetical protein